MMLLLHWFVLVDNYAIQEEKIKTLIFSGTPRKNGDTMKLINEFIKYLDGEYKIIDSYNCNIKPCIDCRYCWKNTGCCINDEMQDEENIYLVRCKYGTLGCI